jgi:transposase-like protein
VITAVREAIESARPKKVVCLSTIGAQATQPNLLSQLTFLEQALSTVSIPVTFLRPAWFMENFAWDISSARASGVIASFLQPETVRRWVCKFGPLFARELRSRRPRPSARWHLDEMAAMIGGKRFWIWRAVDSEGEVLDIVVQRRRDAAAAGKLMRKLMKKQGFAPDVMVTDKLRSYGAAALHECGERPREGWPSSSRGLVGEHREAPWACRLVFKTSTATKCESQRDASAQSSQAEQWPRNRERMARTGIAKRGSDDQTC